MKFVGILSVILVIVFSSTSQAKDENKLIVEIFIESLCKFSKKFITGVFASGYPSVKDIIIVIFYPYGKVIRSRNLDDEWEYDCQHGIVECVTNTKQSCGLDMIGNDQDRKVKFMTCAMGSNNLTHCSKHSNLNHDDIVKCSEGPRGEELQKKAAEETEKVMPKSDQVPTVIFGGNYSEDNSMSAMHNFSETCKRIYEETFGEKGEENKKY